MRFDKDSEAIIHRFQMGTLCRAVHLNKKTILGKKESDGEANDACAGVGNLQDVRIQPRNKPNPAIKYHIQKGHLFTRLKSFCRHCNEWKYLSIY